MLNEKLLELKKLVISQENLVENMIAKSIKGLLEKNDILLKEVIEKDEEVVNARELEIEEQGINLIARFHPEAKDLRTILMILKMNVNLERIADSAVNISESALYLIDKPEVKPLIDLPRMADEAKNMLKDSMESFINESDILAKNIWDRDIIVDNLRDQILRELITYMFSDPSTIERSLHLIRISNNLERIADMATNIAEESIYVSKGKILKRGFKQK